MSGSNALQITDPNADNPLAQAPSWADAYGSVTGSTQNPISDLQTWLAAQRAKSSQMGLWNDQTGLPTGKGLVSAAQQTGNALLMGTTVPGIRAFHGSPYDFERFDTSRIGTGEGAQAYGHGLYFAEKEGTARSYRDNLSQGPMDGLNEALTAFKPYNPNGPAPTAENLRTMLASHPNKALQDAAGNDAVVRDLSTMINGHDLNSGTWSDAGTKAASRIDTHFSSTPPAGKMYEVNIGADPEQFLHWDKPLSEQSPQVQQALAKVHAEDPEAWQRMVAANLKGSELYGSGGIQSSTQAEALRNVGIPGIRYLDQGSRGAGQGTHNYVVFDANTIDILRKYGLAGLGIGLSGVAAGTQQQPPMAQ